MNNKISVQVVVDEKADPRFNDKASYHTCLTYLQAYIVECAEVNNRINKSWPGHFFHPTGDVVKDLADMPIDPNHISGIYKERHFVNPIIVKKDTHGNIREVAGFNMLTSYITYAEFVREFENCLRKNVTKVIEKNGFLDTPPIYVDEQV